MINKLLSIKEKSIYTTTTIKLFLKLWKQEIISMKAGKLSLLTYDTSNIMLVVVWMYSVSDNISMALDKKGQFQWYKLNTNLNGKMKGMD